MSQTEKLRINTTIQVRTMEHVDGKLVGRWNPIPRHDIDKMKATVDWTQSPDVVEKAIADFKAGELDTFKALVRQAGSKGNVCVQVWFHDPGALRVVFAEVVKFAKNLRKGGIYVAIPTTLDDLRIQEITSEVDGKTVVADYVTRWTQVSYGWSDVEDGGSRSEPF